MDLVRGQLLGDLVGQQVAAGFFRGGGECADQNQGFQGCISHPPSLPGFPATQQGPAIPVWPWHLHGFGSEGRPCLPWAVWPDAKRHPAASLHLPLPQPPRARRLRIVLVSEFDRTGCPKRPALGFRNRAAGTEPGSGQSLRVHGFAHSILVHFGSAGLFPGIRALEVEPPNYFHVTLAALPPEGGPFGGKRS